MEISQSTVSYTTELVAATADQEPILANLLELYIYDFSELLEFHVDEGGRFGYPPLALYWKEAGRHPFLIKTNDHWAGFALVRQGSQLSADKQVWDMAEFFVLRGHRRHGIGLQAAAEVWKLFPGKWEVRVMGRNQRAMGFWNRAICEFVGREIQPRPYEKDEEERFVFAFDSPQVS
jgi:predicted acetyltransferase